MRSDERAAQAEIERHQQRGQSIKSGIKTAVGIGTSVVGAGVAGRLMPLLNSLIPTDIAVKGISKISPKLGEMLNEGMSSGLDIKEGLQFLKDKLSGEKQENAQDNRGIIKQYSPELYNFLQDLIGKGDPPAVALGKALNKKEFKPIFEKIRKDHKLPDSLSLVEETFGGGQKALQPQQGQDQGQPQQQQPGQGQQALMAILQKIQASRGG